VTEAEFVVVLIRLIVPLSILRWPLAGGIAAVLADTLDVVIVDALDLGKFRNYAALDKVLDTYYLSLEAYVSLRWEDALARWTSIILFVYRLIGFVLFEATQMRVFLFVFPNLFENFFLGYLGWRKLFPAFYLTPGSLAVMLVLLLIPKMAQEYMLHFAEAKPWGWTKEHIFRDVLWF
jgi:hypothetical protein